MTQSTGTIPWLRPRPMFT